MKSTMHTLLVAALAVAGCASNDAATPATGSPGAAEATPVEQAEAPLALAPRIELIGLGDVYDALSVTDVHFGADLYLLPEGADADAPGDAVAIEFDLVEGIAVTDAPEGALELAAAGRYRVLVRVRPDDAGTSVEVAGGYQRLQARNKVDEPTPTPAEPTPTPAEPTPTPAEPTPTPASPADDPSSQADSPAEPTPTPAEPTPTPAEPTPTPARGKPGDSTEAGAEAVYVRSTRAFEFFAGTVDIQPGDSTLVVTWDVRTWFRALLAQPLGISAEEQAAAAPATVDQSGGFFDEAADFRIIAR
jgi:hypothetical protein